MGTETQNICRACLTEQGTFQSVFRVESNSGISLHVSEMLSNCANIQVTVGDGLPDQICILCAEVTVEMYLFKLRCEKSDKILRTRLEKLASINEENIIFWSEAETVKQPVKSEIKAENIHNLQNESLIEDMNGIDLCDDNESDSNEEIKTTENNEEINECYIDLTLEEFECDICEKQFNQENLLLSHKEDHFLKMNEIEIEFEDIQLNHNSIDQPATKNDEESLYFCSKCEFYFVEKEYLDSHNNKWHKKEPEIPCKNLKRKPLKIKPVDFDLKGFHVSSNYKYHKGEKPYECNICKKKISQLRSLRDHLTVHTGEKPYECDVCKKTFSNLRYMRDHKRIHTGVKPHECNICKKRFLQLGNLKTHTKSHTGERTSKCEICNKTFLHSGHLNRHKKIHAGNKLFECDVCKKVFSHVNYLNIHKRTHTGEKPYGCDVCEKRFSHLGNMAKHKRTHTGEKPSRRKYI